MLFQRGYPFLLLLFTVCNARKNTYSEHRRTFLAHFMFIKSKESIYSRCLLHINSTQTHQLWLFKRRSENNTSYRKNPQFHTFIWRISKVFKVCEYQWLKLQIWLRILLTVWTRYLGHVYCANLGWIFVQIPVTHLIPKCFLNIKTVRRLINFSFLSSSLLHICWAQLVKK